MPTRSNVTLGNIGEKQDLTLDVKTTNESSSPHLWLKLTFHVQKIEGKRKLIARSQSKLFFLIDSSILKTFK